MPLSEPSQGIRDILVELRLLYYALEKQRRFYVFMLMGGVFISVMMAFFLAQIWHPSQIPVGAFITLASLLPSFFFYQLVNGLYIKEAKRSLISALCQVASLRHSPAATTPVKQLERHMIIPPYYRASSVDEFTGAYNGTPYSFMETTLTKLQQDPLYQEQSRELEIFQGVIVRIKVKRGIDSHTVIIPRRLLKAFFHVRFRDYQSVKPDNIKYEHLFENLTREPGAARIVMKTNFMDAFYEAAQMYRARWMVASFMDNEIVMVFQRFRPMIRIHSLWRPMTEDELQRIGWEMDGIFKIIETFAGSRHVTL